MNTEFQEKIFYHIELNSTIEEAATYIRLDRDEKALGK